ncbi:MAG: flagellar hook-length control protein FliK [Syntrophobacteraceae bacterium]
MSVTSNERSKIAQKITSNEFSHELSQLQQYQPTMPGVVTAPQLSAEVGVDSGGMLKAVGPGLMVASQQVIPQELKVQTETAVETGVPSRAKEAGKAGQMKAKALSEQKAEENLFITDLVALERIMAQLKLSAEVRQTCQGTGDKQGRIPLKTLRSLLMSQSTARGLNGSERVAAQDIMELVSSMCQVQNGTASPVQQLNMNSSGSYSLNELNELLKNVVKELADQKQKNTPLVEQKSNVVPVADLKPASTEIEPTLMPEGQLERLATQRIPNFSKAARNSSEESGGAEESSMQPGFAEISATEGARLAAAFEANGNPDGVSQTAKMLGEVTSDDSPAPEAIPFLNNGVSGSGPQSELSSMDADSASQTMVTEKRNGEATGSGLQPFGPDVKVLDHHFVTDQPEVGVQAGSHPETTLSVSRAQQGDESIGQGELDVDGLALHESHDRVSAPEGSGMSSRESGSGGGEQDGESDASLHSSLTKPGEFARAAESAETNQTGFEKVFAEGAALSRGEQTARTGMQESEGKLRFAESSWPDALSKQIEESHRHGRSQMTIELEPESMGKLILRIEADRNHVTAWVSAQNEEAKGLLLNGASSLRQHLEEHGLTLGQFTVDVGQQGGERRFAQTGSGRKQRAGSSRAEGVQRIGMNAALRPMANAMAPDRLISVFA